MSDDKPVKQTEAAAYLGDRLDALLAHAPSSEVAADLDAVGAAT